MWMSTIFLIKIWNNSNHVVPNDLSLHFIKTKCFNLKIKGKPNHNLHQ